MLEIVIPLQVTNVGVHAESVVVMIDDNQIDLVLSFRWKPPAQYVPQIHGHVSESSTVYLAKMIYERRHGRTRYPIRFIDGDCLNCQIANLTTSSKIGYAPEWKEFERPTQRQIDENVQYHERGIELKHLTEWESQMWLRKSVEFSLGTPDEETEYPDTQKP